jgi:hypothetical protein
MGAGMKNANDWQEAADFMFGGGTPDPVVSTVDEWVDDAPPKAKGIPMRRGERISIWLEQRPFISAVLVSAAVLAFMIIATWIYTLLLNSIPCQEMVNRAIGDIPVRCLTKLGIR